MESSVDETIGATHLWGLLRGATATCAICCETKPAPSGDNGALPSLQQLRGLLRDWQWNMMCETSTHMDVVLASSACGRAEHSICRSCMYMWHYVFDRTDCDMCRVESAGCQGVSAGLCTTSSHVTAEVITLTNHFLETFQHPSLEHRHARRLFMERRQSKRKEHSVPVVAQVLSLLSQDEHTFDMSVPCGCCDTLMVHASECHALTHCRHETCFACGETASSSSAMHIGAVASLGPHHWQGKLGCPRYPRDIVPDYMCTDTCNHPCTQQGHQASRNRYVAMIYRIRLRRMWNNLTTDDQRATVLAQYPNVCIHA